MNFRVDVAWSVGMELALAVSFFSLGDSMDSRSTGLVGLLSVE